MKFGLRLKSAVALLLCMALVLLLAVGAGALALRSIQNNLGRAFVRNTTKYNKQRFIAPISRELALSRQFAESEVTKRWLLDETNGAKKELFFAEAEHYRNSFADKSYFLINGLSRHYYFDDGHRKAFETPQYTLSPKLPQDAWFFKSMKDPEPFNINVDYDVKLKVTKVWFNVLVRDGSRNIGMAGTGLSLNSFLHEYINSGDPGVTPMILNADGAIEAYPDPKLIDYSSVTDKGANRSLVYRLLPKEEDRRRMRAALKQVTGGADDSTTFWATLNDRPELFAVSYVPELKWFVVTAVDLKAARVVDSKLWLPFLLVVVLLLAVLICAIVFAVNRIVLTPLFRLTESARAVAAGNYNLILPPAGNDEFGELTQAFGAMAMQVRSHTDELEGKVQERTRELVQVNGQMAEANKKIGDSIQYASLIQNAILPKRELARALSGRHFVLWRPRDVVGGDFYIFHPSEDGYLIGVVDCAGHGVPGAFMTMVAHTAINVAIDGLGVADPAALLEQVDGRVRAMLATDAQRSLVATIMDMGLAYINVRDRTVTFSGAKISLYWCDGETVGETKGDKYAIGGKRNAAFVNKTLKADAGTTFYLTTDGLLDQAGGQNGFSFGGQRFESLVRDHASLPFEQQSAAFVDALEAYQSGRAQRDDITVLSFRFAELRESNESR